VAPGQPVEIELDAVRDTTFQGVVTQVGNTAKVSGLGSQDQVTNFMVIVLLIDSVPNIKPGMTATCDITTDRRDKAIKIPIGAVVLRDEDRLKKNESAEEDDESASSLAVSEAVAAGDGDDASAEADDDEEDDEKKPPLEGVFVVRDGKAVFVEVATGIADQQNIEIISGLEKGEEIVVGSFRTLRELDDGDPVEVKKKDGKKGKGI
jgi:HlyD family secretion protein